MKQSTQAMLRRSHLNRFHKEFGKLVDFAGYEMPVWYKGIIDEHNAVRNAAGLFDVSHMGRFVIRGRESTNFLDHVLPTNVAQVKENRAFYSAICNEKGGIIDDTVTNKFDQQRYLMIVNASNRANDFSWLESHSLKFDVELIDETEQIALMAFQGPMARNLMQKVTDTDLESIKRFFFTECNVVGEKCLVSRTGYTGEDGFEIAVYDTTPEDPGRTMKVWQGLLDVGKESGVLACGLGARDLLRLEAGMCLYGQDINIETTPIEASLENIVDIQKADPFIGKEAIEVQIKNGTSKKRVGFRMTESGIPRHGYEVRLGGAKVGEVTSGTFSPTVKSGIGMAYVPLQLSELGSGVTIRIRETEKAAEVCKMPFYDTSKFGYRREQGI